MIGLHNYYIPRQCQYVVSTTLHATHRQAAGSYYNMVWQVAHWISTSGKDDWREHLKNSWYFYPGIVCQKELFHTSSTSLGSVATWMLGHDCGELCLRHIRSAVALFVTASKMQHRWEVARSSTPTTRWCLDSWWAMYGASPEQTASGTLAGVTTPRTACAGPGTGSGWAAAGLAAAAAAASPQACLAW